MVDKVQIGDATHPKYIVMLRDRWVGRERLEYDLSTSDILVYVPDRVETLSDGLEVVVGRLERVE